MNNSKHIVSGPLPASNDEYRRLIDREIEYVHARQLSLHVQRNTLAPISSLPLDIIRDIFLHYQCGLQGPDTDLYDATSIDIPRMPRDYSMPLEWIKLGHVSHLWRNIALNLPNFWTHISLQNLPWADSAMINERSQKADLILRDCINAGRESRLIPFIVEFLPRIREIDLAVGIGVLLLVLHPQIATSAPLLRCLRLASTNTYERGSEDMTADHDILAEFLTCTEMLRVLEIDFPLRWNSQALMGLTHLKVSHGNHIKRPTSSSVFGALAYMEQLQLLHLVGDALPADDGVLKRRHPNLPALRTLMLNGNMESIFFFINNVNFSRETRVHLKSSSVSDTKNGPYAAKIVSNISQRCWSSGSLSPGTRIRGLDIAIFNEVLPTLPLSDDAMETDGGPKPPCCVHVLHLKAWSIPPSNTVEDPQEIGPTYAIDPFIDLMLPFCHTGSTRIVSVICPGSAQLFQTICGALPCKNLTALSLLLRDNGSINNAFEVDDTFFLDVFGPQPELRSFYTNPPVLQSLLLNMCAPDDSSSSTRAQVLFPALRLLHVTSNFRMCISEEQFTEGLEKRALRHHRLDTLSIPCASHDNPYNNLVSLHQHVANLVQRANA